MSAATASLSRDPRTRHEGGFDRWSYASRSGWSLLWRGSEHADYALGDGNSVWIWDENGRIWSRLPSDEAHAVFREHDLTMRRLRRAVLVVKLLNSKVAGEREAARSALQRIGSAIAAGWQIGFSSHGPIKGFAWFDHPAAVYLAVTHDCRFHMLERERMPFDPTVFAELVAYAQEDFKAGLRPEPPRLRPHDLLHLQANVAHPAHHAANDAHDDPGEYGEAAPAEEDRIAEEIAEALAPEYHPAPDHIIDLREAVAHSVQLEVEQEESRRLRRRRLWLISGSLVAAMAVILGMVGVS